MIFHSGRGFGVGVVWTAKGESKQVLTLPAGAFRIFLDRCIFDAGPEAGSKALST